MPGDKRPTLNEFDYFNEDHSPGHTTVEHEEGDSPTVVRRIEKQRSWFTLLASLAFLGVSAWFMWGYRDAATYAFSARSAPLELGDASTFTPTDIPHNTYVRVHGVTEHRGLTQELVRGLTLSKQKFWYFRLLGSRGTFIEVEPDAQRYGTTTEVTVAGRAVDPSREPLYHELLKGYADIFAAELKADVRIIQVGVEPGTHRAPYVIALLVLGAVGIANIVAVSRVLIILMRRN